MNDHGLSLATETTEVVLIARTKKRAYATFTDNNKKIRIDSQHRITIDSRLSFKNDLRNALNLMA